MVLLNGEGEPLLCGSLKQASFKEATVPGCIPDSPYSGDSFEVWYCLDELEDLRIVHNATGDVLAKPLSEKELMPDNAKPSQVNPSDKLLNFLSIQLPSPFYLPIDLGPFGTHQIEIRSEMEVVSETVLAAVADATANTFLSDDFTQEDPASEATMVDFLHVSLKFSTSRLLGSIHQPTNESTSLLSGSPTYQKFLVEHPDTEAWTIIFINFIILCVAAGLVGWNLRVWVKEFKAGKGYRVTLHAACCSSFLTLVGASISFGLLWKSENEQADYLRSMILVEVVSSSRNDAFPLRIGRGGDPLAATAYLIEVSDGSTKHLGLFISGVFVPLFLVLFYCWFGCHSDELENILQQYGCCGQVSNNF